VLFSGNFMVSKLIFFRQNKLEVFVFLFHLQLVLEQDLQHRDDDTSSTSSGTDTEYISYEDGFDAVEDRTNSPQAVSTCYCVV
jgi:hypothetical protein